LEYIMSQPSSNTTRQLKFGLILSGVGTTQNEWLDPELQGDASININWYIDSARKAEAAKFDLVFIVDSPYITPDSAPHFLNRLEPLTLLSALAVSTSKIGLVATLTTSYWEPYNVARQFASLDQISRGRAGWNVVTTGLEGASRNYGREAHFDHQDRYARAKEFVGVVQGLWDSYEDDAFPRDKETGVFLDKNKLHALNHKGEYYSVAGPLALSRSPQGQPVIFQAGDSNAGRDLGAQIADGTFASAQDYETALAYTTDVKTRAALLGRDPSHVVVMPGLDFIIADSDEEARAIQAERIGQLDLANSLVELGRMFNYHDFRVYDPDAQFPDVSNLSLNSYKSFAERVVRVAREERLTLRQTAERFVIRRSSFVGTAQTIADEIERWFVGGAVDGFNVHVNRPSDVNRFLGEVIPLLQARGLFRSEYTHDTLRGHLGIPIPVNRYSVDQPVDEAVVAA
jgi:FMN-dependent oxidoreductase (nitrilotriacetate monooxygenase family)